MYKKAKIHNEEKKKITLEYLARMVQRGFEATAFDLASFRESIEARVKTLEERMNKFERYVEQEFDTLKAEFKEVKRELHELRKESHVTEADVIALTQRVEHIERQIGIGK